MYFVSLGFCLFAVYITQTAAVKCVLTECDLDKGEYCCARNLSSPIKDCCCYQTPTSITQWCTHHEDHAYINFMYWPGVWMSIIAIAISVGVVTAVLFIRRRRQTDVPYTTLHNADAKSQLSEKMFLHA